MPVNYAGFDVTSTGPYVGIFAYNSGTLSIGHMLPSVTWSSGSSIRFHGAWMAGDA